MLPCCFSAQIVFYFSSLLTDCYDLYFPVKYKYYRLYGLGSSPADQNKALVLLRRTFYEGLPLKSRNGNPKSPVPTTSPKPQFWELKRRGNYQRESINPSICRRIASQKASVFHWRCRDESLPFYPLAVGFCIFACSAFRACAALSRQLHKRLGQRRSGR